MPKKTKKRLQEALRRRRRRRKREFQTGGITTLSDRCWQRASLRDYALPRLGDMPVDAIAGADVMDVLLPIWFTKRETARSVRRRIGAVMKWAVAQGHRPDNPAGAALRRVRASGAHPGTVLAFEFLVLTAARSGEVRNARWEEFDLEGAVWTIPAERMKAKREHRVPLSPPRARRPRRGPAAAARRRHRLPHAHRPHAAPPLHGETAARAGDRRRAAWFPLLVPGLGGGVHRRAARGVRARACARQLRPRGSGLPAQRPVRATPDPDGDMFTIPTLAMSLKIKTCLIRVRCQRTAFG